MVYEGWTLQNELQMDNEWFEWEKFVKTRKRLQGLSFTQQRDEIKTIIATFYYGFPVFTVDMRFPPKKTFIDGSYGIGSCIRRMLAAIDIPNMADYTRSSEAIALYDKYKESYYNNLDELAKIANFADDTSSADKGIFNQQSFESRYKLKWRN